MLTCSTPSALDSCCLHVCCSRPFLPLMTTPESWHDLLQFPQLPALGSARELQKWDQWPLSWLHQASSLAQPKPFHWGSPLIMSICLSHIVSSVSGPLPLTMGIKTKYKGLNEEEMPYSLHLSLLPLSQISPFSSCFQNIHIRSWQKLVISMYVKKKWVDRQLYNFRWLRLESGITRTGFESLISPNTSYILNLSKS